jgi:hypothetical protein
MNEETEHRTIEEKRDWAADGVARWEDRLAAAEAGLERASEMGGRIPGFGGSGNQRAARQVRSAFASADRRYAEASEKLEYFKGKLRYYERVIAERDRKRFGREDLVGATHVRVRAVWRKVARLNAKTVSVETGYSWVDRIPFDQILEFRTISEKAA